MAEERVGKIPKDAPETKGAKVDERSSRENLKAKGALTVPAAEYEALKGAAKERDEYRDKYLRAHAEFENARKRFDKERQDCIKYAQEDFVAGFLPILDSLELAMKHINEKADARSIKEGLEMIHRETQKFLAGLGVERIKTEGQRFDPHLHEAIEVAESNDKEDHAIIEELKPGYMLNGKLIRPAAVKIAKKSEGR